jgi:hypothetical protein
MNFLENLVVEKPERVNDSRVGGGGGRRERKAEP